MSESGIEDLSNVRFQIIKNMLVEFPNLRIEIKKELLIEEINSEKDTIPIRKIFTRTVEGSGPSFQQTYRQEDHNIKGREFNEDIPLWIKFTMATTRKDSNGKYYFFK